MRRAPSPVDGRSVNVAITAAGQDLVDQATTEIEAEIAVLVEVLGTAQRDELSATAGLIVATDASPTRHRHLQRRTRRPAPETDFQERHARQPPKQ